MRNAYNILIVEPKGKRPVGRPRRRWEDIIMVKVKIKVKLSLHLTKHHAMKTYWGVEV
jgi:hypothetical protein